MNTKTKNNSHIFMLLSFLLFFLYITTTLRTFNLSDLYIFQYFDFVKTNFLFIIQLPVSGLIVPAFKSTFFLGESVALDPSMFLYDLSTLFIESYRFIIYISIYFVTIILSIIMAIIAILKTNGKIKYLFVSLLSTSILFILISIISYNIKIQDQTIFILAFTYLPIIILLLSYIFYTIKNRNLFICILSGLILLRFIYILLLILANYLIVALVPIFNLANYISVDGLFIYAYIYYIILFIEKLINFAVYIYLFVIIFYFFIKHVVSIFINSEKQKSIKAFLHLIFIGSIIINVLMFVIVAPTSYYSSYNVLGGYGISNFTTFYEFFFLHESIVNFAYVLLVLNITFILLTHILYILLIKKIRFFYKILIILEYLLLIEDILFILTITIIVFFIIVLFIFA